MQSNSLKTLFKDVHLENQIKVKETSLDLLAIKNILDKLDFDNLFNDHVIWDSNQWSVTPADLAKLIIFLPYHITGSRIPIYRINQAYETVDMELLFESGISPLNINDDNIGRMLDRFNESGCSDFFTKFALTVYEKLNLNISNTLHADTTTHVLYGEYNDTTAENCEGPMPKHGHSKANRNDLKQIVQGMVTDENGMPIFVNVCDGNKADCTWNGETISELSNFMGDSMSDYIYIADSKFTTKKNFELLNGLDHSIQFISRMPNNFSSKAAEKAKIQAYENDQWLDIGTYLNAPPEKSNLSTYHAYSINKNIYGHDCRIIVYKGDGHRNEHKFLSLIKKDKKKIEKDFKMSFSRKKHIFLCISDAINAANLFVDKRKNGFHDIIWDVEEIIEFKKPRGRPSKNQNSSKNPNTSKIQTPPKKIISYRVVLKEVKENEERIVEICNKKASFVLVTNVEESELDEKAILRKYKGQKCVEDNFSIIKRPLMAQTYFLHKPERIEALLTLLSIALLLQIILKLLVHKNLQELNFIPNLDNHRKPLLNPSSKKIIDMMRNYGVITSGKKKKLVIKNNMFADGLLIWSFLAELSDYHPSENHMN